jgi:hypothetical protein
MIGRPSINEGGTLITYTIRAAEKLKISVIICTKNRVQELVSCIKSVIDQSVSPDEIKPQRMKNAKGQNDFCQTC